MSTTIITATVLSFILLILPTAYGRINTNVREGANGLELPLYSKNFVLSCNHSNSDHKLDHWELNGYELQGADREALGIHQDSSNGSLIISNPRKHHEGNYTCVFTNKEEGRIVVKAKPESSLESEDFVPGTPSLSIVHGSVLNLICRSKSNDSVSLRWLTQPEDLSDDDLDEISSDPAYNVFQNSSSTPESTVALLIIKSIRYEDRAFYICRADNGVATSETRILIRVKDKLAPLWPFLGIVAEVAILCTVICVYENQKSKNNDLDDDVTNVSGKPTSPSKAVHEVRHRK